MHLTQFKEALKTANSLRFRLPNGQLIPQHFHITEVGESLKKFIDCGNTVREEKYIVFQLWYDQDTSHRLSPKKLLTIIEQSEKVLNLEDLEIRVEYQGTTINIFKLASTNDGSFKLDKTETGLPTILLRPTTTTCLPFKSTSKCFNINIMPLGVHGINRGRPIDNNPAFSG